MSMAEEDENTIDSEDQDATGEELTEGEVSAGDESQAVSYTHLRAHET